MTAAIKKIKLPLFDLKYDKIKENIKHHIELYDTHLLWVIECWLDKHPKPDDDLGLIKENQYCNEVDFIPKNKIISIESYFDSGCELWVLVVYFGERSTDCKFETESEMRKAEIILHEWYVKN